MVCLPFPEEAAVVAVENTSLSVDPKEFVSIVGPSGCGKSTIIQLVERFYDPQSGVVMLDGVDVPRV